MRKEKNRTGNTQTAFQGHAREFHSARENACPTGREVYYIWGRGVIEFDVKSQSFKTISRLRWAKNPMKCLEGRKGDTPFKNNLTKDSVFPPCLVVSIISDA